MELFLAAEYDTNIDVRAVSTNENNNKNTSDRSPIWVIRYLYKPQYFYRP